MNRRSFFGMLLVTMLIAASSTPGLLPEHPHPPDPRQERLRVAIVMAPMTDAGTTSLPISDPAWEHVGHIAYVDSEAMRVVATTPAVVVMRGTHGTRAQFHEVGARVFIGPPDRFYQLDPGDGWCGRVEHQAVPYIAIHTGTMWVCPYPESDWIQVPK